MNLLTGIAIAAVALLLAGAFVYLMVIAWRRTMQDDGPLPLFGMLGRHNISPEALEAAASPEQQALAISRCAVCGGKEQCRAILASDKPEGIPGNCPNVELFKQAALRQEATQ